MCVPKVPVYTVLMRPGPWCPLKCSVHQRDVRFINCVPVHMQVSVGSKEPVSIVVEEWEESQERVGAGEGGEKEESMDVSLSEPVDEPANPRLFERHLAVSE